MTFFWARNLKNPVYPSGVPQAQGGTGRRPPEAQVPGGDYNVPVGVLAQAAPGQG